MLQRNLPLSPFKIAREKLFPLFKKFLKKTFTWALPALCLLSSISCTGKGKESPKQVSSVETPEVSSKIRVLSTTSMIGDLVAEIGSDLIDHTTLICGEIDPHNYELVKGDDELFTSSQIVFCHGDNLEHGASLHSQIHAHPHAVQINHYIEKTHPHLMIPLPEGGIDPHLWLDASLWSEAVDPIADHLSQAMPDHEKEIRENAAHLKEEILKTDRWILGKFSQIDSNKKYLVSTHDAFRYFSRHYLTDVGGDFNLHAVAPEGVAPEGQIGFHQIKNMVDFVITHQITYLFQESNLRPDSLKKICSVCASKGIEVKIFPDKLYADTTGATPVGKSAYISMMKTNANALIKAWQTDTGTEDPESLR